jgi:hypothetical protein
MPISWSGWRYTATLKVVSLKFGRRIVAIKFTGVTVAFLHRVPAAIAQILRVRYNSIVLGKSLKFDIRFFSSSYISTTRARGFLRRY